MDEAARRDWAHRLLRIGNVYDAWHLRVRRIDLPVPLRRLTERHEFRGAAASRQDRPGARLLPSGWLTDPGAWHRG